MEKVLLVTNADEVVTTVEIPPMNPPAGAILWGARFFVLVPHTEGLSRAAWAALRADDEPLNKYRETFVWACPPPVPFGNVVPERRSPSVRPVDAVGTGVEVVPPSPITAAPRPYAVDADDDRGKNENRGDLDGVKSLLAQDGGLKTVVLNAYERPEHSMIRHHLGLPQSAPPQPHTSNDFVVTKEPADFVTYGESKKR